MKPFLYFALAFQACALAFFAFQFAVTGDGLCAVMTGWSCFFAGLHTWQIRKGGVRV